MSDIEVSLDDAYDDDVPEEDEDDFDAFDGKTDLDLVAWTLEGLGVEVRPDPRGIITRDAVAEAIERECTRLDRAEHRAGGTILRLRRKLAQAKAKAGALVAGEQDQKMKCASQLRKTRTELAELHALYDEMVPNLQKALAEAEAALAAERVATVAHLRHLAESVARAGPFSAPTELRYAADQIEAGVHVEKKS